MITAADVAKLIDENDPRIDTFIEKVLTPKFIELGHSIQMPTEAVMKYFEYSIGAKRFEDQMIKRGFYIQYECDDRPAGSCWFNIAIPPQGE